MSLNSAVDTNGPSSDLNNGVFKLGNPHIERMDEDVLYHFALSTKTHDLKAMFGDVKYVCMGGSPKRMKNFAYFLLQELSYSMPAGQTLVDIAEETDRYAMYKVGPVLSVSHGMGIPSVSIMLHEIIKLIYHAGCKDVEFFRIGTSGGLGLEPGTVVITDQPVDGMLNSNFEVPVLGRKVSYPSHLDDDLSRELRDCSTKEDGFETVFGNTMCTDDFYEGQGRIDGAFCDYTEKDKMDYLLKIHKKGVRNIEMESVCFGAMCHRAGLKGAVVCVTLLDRLKGDQVSTPHNILEKWQERPQLIVARHIKKRLASAGNSL